MKMLLGDRLTTKNPVTILCNWDLLLIYMTRFVTLERLFATRLVEDLLSLLYFFLLQTWVELSLRYRLCSLR